MCDDFFDDFDEGFEDGDDEDFGQSSNDAKPNPDDCEEGINWEDFTLGMGLGQELAYGERKRRRNRDAF